MTIFLLYFLWQFLMTILRFLENFQMFRIFSDFLKILWPDTWHLRHWLHCWQLRTTILTITLWPLNKEWGGQHSQLLRCFVSLLPCYELKMSLFWLFGVQSMRFLRWRTPSTIWSLTNAASVVFFRWSYWTLKNTLLLHLLLSENWLAKLRRCISWVHFEKYSLE